MKNTFTALGLIAGLTAAGAACAQVSVTGEVGTTGIGAHVSVPLRSNLNARFGTGYFTYTYKDSTLFVNYDLKFRIYTIDAILDWSPVQDSGFRLTRGWHTTGSKRRRGRESRAAIRSATTSIR